MLIQTHLRLSEYDIEGSDHSCLTDGKYVLVFHDCNLLSFVLRVDGFEHTGVNLLLVPQLLWPRELLLRAGPRKMCF